MATLAELRERVRVLLGRTDQADSRVTDARVDAYLADGLLDFARQTGFARRTHTVTAAAGQATFALPPDCARVVRARMGSDVTDLARLTRAELTRRFPSWRSYGTGSPRFWYAVDGRAVGLFPAPAAADTLALELVAAPYGLAVVSAVRAAGVLTVSCAGLHPFAVGDLVQVTTPGYAATAAAVTTVPDVQVFCVASVGADGTGTGGAAGYADGLLPLLQATDAPAFPGAFALAPAYYAAWQLGPFVSDDPVAVAGAAAAHQRYAALVGACLAAGVG